MLTVLEEKPWAYALNNSAAKKYCHFCFNKITSPIKCSDCRFAKYCSTNCAEKAAHEHKPECRLLRAAERIPNEKIRLMSRILIKLQRGEEAPGPRVNVNLQDFNYNSYHDLESCEKEMAADEERMMEFCSIQKALQVYMTKRMLPEASELFKIYCRMARNVFNIPSSTMIPVGIGIYLTLSQLKHSCSPNSMIIYDGVTGHLNFFGEIDEDAKPELAKISISYLPMIGDRAERRRALQKRYYFTCQCIRCMNDGQNSLESSCTCPVGSCRGHEFEVENCGDSKCEMSNETATVLCPADLMIRTPDDFAQIKRAVRAGNAALMSRLNYMYVAAEGFLEKHENTLLPTHVQLIRTESVMAKAAYFKGSYIEAASLYENIIWRLERYMPENLPLLSLAEMAVSRLCLMTGDLVRTKQHLLNACDLSRRCYRREHPTHNMVLRFLDDCERRLIGKGIDPYGIEYKPSEIKSITTLQGKPKGSGSGDKEEKEDKEHNKTR
ncbi:zf-MYND domain containing protein [Trichuris trichiura]|uniref:Zf-MYND domain containing protein n=1 Tax=Trichuris trichiura TaxID=36087 RepID=A0A077YXG8_TRITR|nr:zf-MYND domain containing protein [Trichuris trichiura]